MTAINDRALDAFDEVPKQLLSLIVNPCELDIRKQAQGLLATCGNVEAVLGELMAYRWASEIHQSYMYHVHNLCWGHVALCVDP